MPLGLAPCTTGGATSTNVLLLLAPYKLAADTPPPRDLWSNWTIAPISCCCLLPTIIFYAQCCSISLARQETEKGKVLGCWDENGIKIRISFSGQVNVGRDGWEGGCNRVGWDAVGVDIGGDVLWGAFGFAKSLGGLVGSAVGGLQDAVGTNYMLRASASPLKSQD